MPPRLLLTLRRLQRPADAATKSFGKTIRSPSPHPASTGLASLARVASIALGSVAISDARHTVNHVHFAHRSATGTRLHRLEQLALASRAPPATGFRPHSAPMTTTHLIREGPHVGLHDSIALPEHATMARHARVLERVPFWAPLMPMRTHCNRQIRTRTKRQRIVAAALRWGVFSSRFDDRGERRTAPGVPTPASHRPIVRPRRPPRARLTATAAPWRRWPRFRPRG